MTLSDDDLPPVVAHRRELDLDRGSHHGIKSKPHRDMGDQKDRALELLAEDIKQAEQQKLYWTAKAVALRAEYQRVKAWGPDPAPLPVVDGRCFDAGSADTAEEWRSPSGRRSA